MKRQHIEEEQEVLRQITEASDAIRRKYEMIKRGRADADRLYADMLKPVVTPLKALAEKQEKPVELKKEMEIKEEIQDIGKIEADEYEEEAEAEDLLRDTREAVRKANLDTVWGIRESGGQLMLGDSVVQTQGNQLTVGGKSYVLTPGLLELLLKKHPHMSHITPQDWEHYQTMVTSTNANRKRYLKTGRIRSRILEKN